MSCAANAVRPRAACSLPRRRCARVHAASIRPLPSSSWPVHVRAPAPRNDERRQRADAPVDALSIALPPCAWHPTAPGASVPHLTRAIRPARTTAEGSVVGDVRPSRTTRRGRSPSATSASHPRCGAATAHARPPSSLASAAHGSKQLHNSRLRFWCGRAWLPLVSPQQRLRALCPTDKLRGDASLCLDASLEFQKGRRSARW